MRMNMIFDLSFRGGAHARKIVSLNDKQRRFLFALSYYDEHHKDKTSIGLRNRANTISSLYTLASKYRNHNFATYGKD